MKADILKCPNTCQGDLNSWRISESAVCLICGRFKNRNGIGFTGNKDIPIIPQKIRKDTRL